MPPRKSNVSTTSNGAEDGVEPATAKPVREGLSVEVMYRAIPETILQRIDLLAGSLDAKDKITMINYVDYLDG